ncbi:MAG TPA: peptide ABC transporter ATP-binding protein [Firmicutes bacterium]|jgi:oligopeptide/dipeptide ABC transporter ATP-binding protein|nr:peptide ABC transporter ATP-binding protein [Bacillota bacterium]
MAVPLLEVKNLQTHFFTENGIVKAVNGVSFSLNAGKILCIVGESGCGKSITSLSIMRLLTSPPGRIVGGEVIFEGIDLLKLKESEMYHIRGNKISMIFQEPMTSLNPVFTIGNQMMESIMLHRRCGAKEAREQAAEMLHLVGISSPEKRIHEYPHQLSGGMRQRVMIAMALSCNPKLLIADEPTTALDVTIQAQILDLMRKLRAELGTSVILITHDLGVVAEMADEVIVMYCGAIVERADVQTLFENPKHPYTKGLLGSVPNMEVEIQRLPIVRGMVPDPYNMPAGCAFCPRCDYATDACRQETPPLVNLDSDHNVRCFRYIHDRERVSSSERCAAC